VVTVHHLIGRMESFAYSNNNKKSKI